MQFCERRQTLDVQSGQRGTDMEKIKALELTAETRAGLYSGILVFWTDAIENRFASGDFCKDFERAYAYASDMADRVVIDPSVDREYSKMAGRK
jgi:hypothetical protein